jgi:hypothetical protein
MQKYLLTCLLTLAPARPSTDTPTIQSLFSMHLKYQYPQMKYFLYQKLPAIMYEHLRKKKINEGE